MTRTIRLDRGGRTLDGFDASKVAPVRFRKLKDGYVATTEVGKYALLTEAEFDAYMRGALPANGALHRDLQEKGFIRDRMDMPRIIRDWRRANSFLWQAPTLHMIVVTLRCNYTCVYCHAASVKMNETQYDMTPETAEKVVDCILSSPSPVVSIEFQGGEPLVNWPVVRHIVEYARKRNETLKKNLLINMVSNMSLMDDEKLTWLLERDVNFCTSIDGTREIHDRNRTYLGGNSYAVAAHWFKEIFRRTENKMYRIDALLTATRLVLPFHKEVVDEYVGLGARGIFLRCLNPFGFASRTWEAIGYTPEEYLEFYRKALDYIIEVNLAGRPFMEQYARVCLSKIVHNEDPGFIDMRSPYGLGGLAYNYDGGVYLADEGRMIGKMGDDAFKLGDVRSGTYTDFVDHPTMRSIVTASVLETQPECSTCAYKPYCGQSPIHNYVEQGDISARTPLSAWHIVHQGIFDLLFEKLKDPAAAKVLHSWVEKRPIMPPPAERDAARAG